MACQSLIIFSFIIPTQFIWKNYLVHETNKQEFNLSFSFTNSEFEKLKIDEKEFLLNEKMYDIVHSEIMNDSVKIIAFEDSFEKKLIHLISKTMSNEDFNINDLIEKILSFVFILPESEIKSVINSVDSEQKIFCTELEFEKLFITEILKPPSL